MHEPQPDRSPLLTAHEVGELLGLDTSTVYRMAGDGRLPAIKVGRQWRFPSRPLHRALDAGVPPTGGRPEANAFAMPRVGPDASKGPGQGSGPDHVPAPAPWTDPALVVDVVGLAAEALGVMMVVTDMSGRPVTPILNPCPALAGRTSDPALLAACSAEWSDLASALDFEPRFAGGALGFECARALVRSGPRLIGMVLAGGVAASPPTPAATAPAGTTDPAAGLYTLSTAERERVLHLLPLVAATLSRLAGHVERANAAVATAPEGGSR